MDNPPASDRPTSSEPYPDVTVGAGGSTGDSQQREIHKNVELLVGQSEARRYQVQALLGRGGMGEVFLALDDRIGRGVALKVSLDPGERQEVLRTRFFREARVQGNLEHPGIVPVYDLDRDTNGRDFFAMKRVAGVTLEAVVRSLANGDPDAEAKYPMRRLLAAFLQVCLAVDYAHSNGVVHRDLKLSNLMLGDFGEVYVLDWGVAKVVGGNEFPYEPDANASAALTDATEDEMLGTLGYMAPEQIRDSTGVDRRADVYALGVILFMLLARKRLHPQKDRVDIAIATGIGCDARASVRSPHLKLPPELDTICVKATAVDPEQRYPNARELHDDVQRFLEGDRDMRLRVEVACRHLDEAKRVLACNDDEAGGPVERRRRALQQTGRALAVHPESEDAAALMGILLLTPPEGLPPEVEQETRKLSQHEIARLGAAGGTAMLTMVIFALALMNWVGVRSWTTVSLFLCFATLSAVASTTADFAPGRAIPHVVSCMFFAVALMMMSRVAGPLSFPPFFLMVNIIFLNGAHGLGRWRLVCVAISATGVLVPWGLETAGVLESQYVLEDGSLRILEGAVEFRPSRAIPAAVISTLGPLAGCMAVLWHYSSADQRTRRRLQLMAWHFRQLVHAGKPTTPIAASDDATHHGPVSAR